MKRPAFQFYPADWRNNAKLRRCSEAARGAWIDVLCLMHDSDEYGVLRWPLAEIARAAGLPLKLLKELAERGVLKGGDKGCEAFYHTPIHARKQGEPILMLAETNEHCWYSSRFLVDEWRRSVKGVSTRFNIDDKTPNDSPSHGKVKAKVNESDSPSRTPSARQGDGSTSTSTSTIKPSVIDTGSNTPPAHDSVCTTAGEICKAIKLAGITDINQSNPTFVALLAAGAGVDEFAHAAAAARQNNKPHFNYILGIVKKQREDAAKLVLHQSSLPASASAKEAGRQIAASSIFKPEHTQHLQTHHEKTVEADYVQIK